MESTLHRHQESFSQPRSLEAKRYDDAYRTHKQDLKVTASRIRDEAVSYREFKVGCALLAEAPEGKTVDYTIHFGYNFKPVKGSEKLCAERNAFESAIGDQSPHIIAIVTVSQETSTGDPNQSHSVLHPCDMCRTMLMDYRERGVISGDTIICCVNDGEGTEAEEECTVDQLLARYNDSSIPAQAVA
ncbi:hypothetical protein HY624_03190 [Candidatus Uhrbacteria bacterium]|nr:hypothetical protein [Candidatus Uhrbacteria bacterium]